MSNWKNSLRELKKLETNERFRYNLQFIAVSDIAQQFYCEAKVDQQHTIGEIPSQQKTTGSLIHEEIFTMESVELENLIKSIEIENKVIATFPLVATINHLRIIGVPDAIIFLQGQPNWIIELKSSTNPNPRVWPDQEVQIRLYGLLLEKMGFDCSTLKLILIHIRQDNKLNFDKKREILDEISTLIDLNSLSEAELRYGMKISRITQDRLKTEESIKWAKAFWLNSREPIPTKNPSKCKSCVYNNKCSYNLFK
jgi:CRISPR/Cas system-associated exonuclease Cas4 (RecB family)